jgi:transcriptional regulator with XRE-family HTH domain
VFINMAKPRAAACQHNDGGISMITGAQCRSARTLLTWSVSKLASAASVSESDIDDFELERRRPPAATLEAIKRALEEVGVRFLANDDVRLGMDETLIER